MAVDEIDAFVAGLPRHVAVILDEAYVEFNLLQDPSESIDLVNRHSNLVVLRTFSKVYGLCGLRAGYAIGSSPSAWPWTACASPSRSTPWRRPPAAEAVRHTDEVERRIEHTVIERLHMESEFEERGLETTDSQANFSWVSLGERDEDAIVRGLAERGVIVRAGTALGGAGNLRVTYGTREQNSRFLDALDELLSPPGSPPPSGGRGSLGPSRRPWRARCRP